MCYICTYILPASTSGCARRKANLKHSADKKHAIRNKIKFEIKTQRLSFGCKTLNTNLKSLINLTCLRKNKI